MASQASSGITEQLAGETKTSLCNEGMGNTETPAVGDAVERRAERRARRTRERQALKKSTLSKDIDSSKDIGDIVSPPGDGEEKMPARRPARRSPRAGNSSLSSSFSNSNSLDLSKAVGNTGSPSADGGDKLPARRATRQSRAANPSLSSSFSNSLRGDRNTGLKGTKGRLSVSFSDEQGLSAATIGDILSEFEDGEDEKEMSMEDLLGVGKEGGRDEKKVPVSRTRGTRGKMQLMTIQSQRSVTFTMDPNDFLLSSDEE